jgi:hypothetical protein
VVREVHYHYNYYYGPAYSAQGHSSINNAPTIMGGPVSDEGQKPLGRPKYSAKNYSEISRVGTGVDADLEAHGHSRMTDIGDVAANRPPAVEPAAKPKGSAKWTPPLIVKIAGYGAGVITALAGLAKLYLKLKGG